MKGEGIAVLVTVVILAVIIYVKAGSTSPYQSGGSQVANVLSNFFTGASQIVSALTGGGGKYPGSPPYSQQPGRPF